MYIRVSSVLYVLRLTMIKIVFLLLRFEIILCGRIIVPTRIFYIESVGTFGTKKPMLLGIFLHKLLRWIGINFELYHIPFFWVNWEQQNTILLICVTLGSQKQRLTIKLQNYVSISWYFQYYHVVNRSLPQTFPI